MKQIVSATVLTAVEGAKAWVNLININDREVELTQGTRLGIAECRRERGEIQNLRAIETAKRKTVKKDNYRPIVREDISCEDESVSSKLLELLNRRRATCWLQGEELGLYKGDPLRIDLPPRISAGDRCSPNCHVPSSLRNHSRNTSRSPEAVSGGRSS